MLHCYLVSLPRFYLARRAGPQKKGDDEAYKCTRHVFQNFVAFCAYIGRYTTKVHRHTRWRWLKKCWSRIFENWLARWTQRKWLRTSKDFLRMADEKYRSYYQLTSTVYSMETSRLSGLPLVKKRSLFKKKTISIRISNWLVITSLLYGYLGCFENNKNNNKIILFDLIVALNIDTFLVSMRRCDALPHCLRL